MKSDNDREDYRKFFFKCLILALAALTGCSPLGQALKEREKRRTVFSFYGLPGYLARDTIFGFEKKYNIETNYDELLPQDVLYGKIKLGIMNCDLILVSEKLTGKMIREKLLSPLDRQKITNLGNLYPFFKKASIDPTRCYSIPWNWSILVIAYNKNFVKEKIDSWKILWNDKYSRKISMPKDKREALGCTLIMLGASLDCSDKRKLKEAKKLLKKQRALLYRQEKGSYLEKLAAGKVWLAVGRNRDILKLQKSHPEIDFVIPKEGSIIRVHYLCIPREALHPNYAQQFMDYVLNPQISAEIAADTDSASPSLAAEKYLRAIRKELLRDKRIYPPPEVMKKLKFYKEIDEKYLEGI